MLCKLPSFLLTKLPTNDSPDLGNRKHALTVCPEISDRSKLVFFLALQGRNVIIGLGPFEKISG
jgi:hypothetical protein